MRSGGPRLGLGRAAAAGMGGAPLRPRGTGWRAAAGLPAASVVSAMSASAAPLVAPSAALPPGLSLLPPILSGFLA